jgi:hypothetical protein
MDTHRDRFAVVMSDDRCGTRKKEELKAMGKAGSLFIIIESY